MIFGGRAVQQASISAVVLRADGSVKKDLGVVGYWHKNPLRRLAWKIKTWASAIWAPLRGRA
jgi:hypothetical protein